MTPQECRTQINRLKKIMGFKIPIDGLMTVILQRPVIDIIALDEKLMKEFNYDGSMNDFVKLKYGDEALNILENN